MENRNCTLDVTWNTAAAQIHRTLEESRGLAPIPRAPTPLTSATVSDLRRKQHAELTNSTELCSARVRLEFTLPDSGPVVLYSGWSNPVDLSA